MSLFERVANRNKKESLVENGDRIVVGFSGGPDSVFLVEMLLKLREKIDFDIVLVHINHLLRGEEAQRDEDFSINYGKSKGLKVFVRKINITSLGKEKGLSLEEAGREARYSFYKEVLEKSNSNKIALAHNKDDQIETFMFRLTRGTGLSGLEGIATKRDRYIRPISEIYKSEIVNYLDENNISYCIDSTNLENEFTRNSIRIDLIPFIEKRYNPKFKDKIFSLIEEIRDINIFIEKEIEQFSYDETINIESILKFPKSIRGKILSKYLYKYGLEVNRKKISLIESILEKGGSQEISLDSQYILKKEYNILKIQKINLIKNNIEEVTFTIPNKIKYGDYIIEAEYVERGEQNKNCFYTNLKLGDTLIVRGRKDGDKIIPTGMKGEKKLKEIFINEKIGKEKRDSIPLIVHNDNIVWIAGVRGNEKYNSTEKRCIKLSVRRTK
ncbi:MAG: tRNA lysidine(34) synthetase TilS [Fusobacterium mortiferum]|mgnify:FL=1|uniref:tRNA lysidine(34) synthetase TilS n=1 Tax=Fusobacterium mortiferum TaxID=850 RepID=UPI000E46F242|nr:tRNA lysidine(34) synthetase TilS [Fusobacterium mortiferum]MDD7262410.1 tRNA lysidine(34) synthetase TilS [Fusobacterium mortiferum]RHF64638.1 tRNA lysidine(34) synthetase TilS [Fusobacterium mortiferum]